jgi:hypothetical protein
MGWLLLPGVHSSLLSRRPVGVGGDLMIYRFLQGQASVPSYIDIAQYIAILCGCVVPRVFLMKDRKGTKAAVH